MEHGTWNGLMLYVFKVKYRTPEHGQWNLSQFFLSITDFKQLFTGIAIKISKRFDLVALWDCIYHTYILILISDIYKFKKGSIEIPMRQTIKMSRTLHFKLCSFSVSTKTECISIVENFGNKFWYFFKIKYPHFPWLLSHKRSLWTFFLTLLKWKKKLSFSMLSSDNHQHFRSKILPTK